MGWCWRPDTPSASTRQSWRRCHWCRIHGFVEVHRLGTFPERSLDIDVIFDLMIHDLDLLLTSVKSEVTSIEAIGVNVLTRAPTSPTSACGLPRDALRT